MTQIIGLAEARTVLADLGIELTERQMKRAADVDAHGMRKLPFFVDPIDRKLKINKAALTGVYEALTREAEQNAYYVAPSEVRHHSGFGTDVGADFEHVSQNRAQPDVPPQKPVDEIIILRPEPD